MFFKCGFILFAGLFHSGLTVIDVPKQRDAQDPDWWKNGVFYQIYPRSFKDSNKDGIGDLPGITSKLDDLVELGITGIWLSPIYKSGGVDQGYDISDFKDIEEEYGTMDDFKDLMSAAHEKGIKVILDYVPNHSSSKCQWFMDSEDSKAGFEDFYVWYDGKIEGTERKPPNNWLSVFHGPAWTFSTKRNQWYLHQFSPQQPDLNYNSSLVKQTMKEVLEFWLDLGVDGFRVDAVPFIFEDDQLRDEPPSNDPNAKPNEHESLKHIYTKDQDKTFELIYELRAHIDKYNTEHPTETSRILMSEGYTNIENTMKYYEGNGREGMHIPFNLLLVPHNKTSGAISIVKSINEWFDNMPEGKTANWVVGNHDIHRVATRFGPELVDNINILIAFLPGIMVTYNGEEIGQENGNVTKDQGADPRGCNALDEDFDRESRDFERTPYHWSDDKYAGFTDPDTVKTWLPVSEKYTENNLKKQKGHPKSHFEIYKFILTLRQRDVFKNGETKVEALSDSIIKVTRGSMANDNGNYVVLINISKWPQKVKPSGNDRQLYQVVYSLDDSFKTEEKILDEDVIIPASKAILFKVIGIIKQVHFDWWKHAVIYQIYPKSFKDNNNDGIGDLKGIIEKLPYLKELGVDAVWLSPVYKSPQADQGYDVSDFKAIDPIYGTMEDFENLISKAKQISLKIIIDFVPNHSSNQHKWFTKSEDPDTYPDYKDYYVWRDGVDGGPPNNWLSVFKNSSWTKSTKRNQYYLHQFDYRQPDLNYRSTAVQNEMKDILTFWLETGISGFRMTSVPYLFEDEAFPNEPSSNHLAEDKDTWKSLKHIYTSNLQETFDLIYDWRNLLDIYTAENGGDERIMITDANTDIHNTMYYYGTKDKKGAHLTLNFQLMEKVNGTSTANDFAAKINEWIDLIPEGFTSNWGLGNHDNRRVATRLRPENVDGFNMLIAILPGVMVTYNGEEIGQEDGVLEVNNCDGDPIFCPIAEQSEAEIENLRKLRRDRQRTPFHWDSSLHAGFTKREKGPWLPVGPKYAENNLQKQINQTSSHYELYKRLLKLRRKPAFVSGSLKVKAVTDYVLASLRYYTANESYFHLFNLRNEIETFNLKTAYNETSSILEVIETNDHENLPVGTLLDVDYITLQGHQSVVAKFIVTGSSPSIYAASSCVVVLGLMINIINFS